MRHWFCLAFLCMATGHSGLAKADGNVEFFGCSASYLQHDYDTALKHCNAALQSGDLSKTNTADALNGRGNVYVAKGDYGKAIQDYDQAIRLVPGLEAAYNDRGNAYNHMGDYDAAIQSFNQATRLNPDDAWPYVGRAAAYENRGEHDRAVKEYDQAIQRDPNSPYISLWKDQILFETGRFGDAVDASEELVGAHPTFADGVLWLNLAQRRAGYLADGALKVNAQALDLEQWPGPVVRLYLGQITRDALKGAVGDQDPTIARRKSCEAPFYIAELDVVSGQAEAARSGFQHVIDSCPKGWNVVRLATIELGRM
jgi:lipoprotein NlpI